MFKLKKKINLMNKKLQNITKITKKKFLKYKNILNENKLNIKP